MKLVQRQRVELDFAQLTDKSVHDLVSGIKLAAPTSLLVLNSAPMQTSVAAILAKDTALTQSGATVTDDKAKLKTDLATEATCRSGLCAEIRVFATLDTSYPAKGHGKAMVSVHETGKTRRQYAAEWSPETIGPNSWAQLGVGHGKTRSVIGASGTKVWVRFATVRGQQQSDWCTPVLVTIP